MKRKWLFYAKLITTQIFAISLAMFVIYSGAYIVSIRAQTLPYSSTQSNLKQISIRLTQPAIQFPTIIPTNTPVPFLLPTEVPTSIPTSLPTAVPTTVPIIQPTKIPTKVIDVPTSVPKTITNDSGNAGLSSIESEMVTLINQKRGGLAPLSVNAQLVEAARRESRDNANKGNVNDCNHTGSDGSSFTTRAHDAGFGGFAHGETIGCGHQSAQSIVDGWWNSPGHYAILNNDKITMIGVGWISANQTAQTAVVGY